MVMIGIALGAGGLVYSTEALTINLFWCGSGHGDNSG